jgi:hypothetical protein
MVPVVSATVMMGASLTPVQLKVSRRSFRQPTVAE